MTRNLSTRIFGIKPGMISGDGKEKILQAGLVDSNNTIFSLTLELLD